MKDAQLVERVRDEFEHGNADRRMLEKLYRNTTDANPGNFVQAALESFPDGNCSIASLYLRQKLRKGKVVTGRFHGEPHAFLLLNPETRYIADITADQYGGPKVYIGPLVQPWSLD